MADGVSYLRHTGRGRDRGDGARDWRALAVPIAVEERKRTLRNESEQ
jgi:hypothetical protein